MKMKRPGIYIAAFVLRICFLAGFRRASEGREPLKDNRRPLWRSRPRLGLHHSTVLTDSLHPRSRSSLSYNRKYTHQK